MVTEDRRAEIFINRESVGIPVKILVNSFLIEKFITSILPNCFVSMLHNNFRFNLYTQNCHDARDFV